MADKKAPKQVRIPEHLHKQAKDYAREQRMTLEGVIELAIINGLNRLRPMKQHGKTA